MEPQLEQNKTFWAATLGNDKLRSRVAASLVQQLAFCTYQTNNGRQSTAFGVLPSSLPSYGGNSSNNNNNALASHEPFESSSPPQKSKVVGSSSSMNNKTATQQITSTWKSINNSSSTLQLPAPRLVTASQRKQMNGNNNSNSSSVTTAVNRNSPLLQQNASSASNLATSPGHINNQGSSKNISPSTTGKAANNNSNNANNNNTAGQFQTPRNEDFTTTSSGKQWRSHLMLAEKIFGHAISVKLPIQNRGASACRAAALGETWSAFLDAEGHVRLCGSGAQSLNCRPDHRFTQIAWVGDFIAMVDDRQDLYIARVSGSSSGLRSPHVLQAFIAQEGQPVKLMDNVAEVSGTAAGLLVLNLNGEVFFYSVQKPRQAPPGGIVPYRASSTVLLSPQLDIFVLDGLTKMLHKCSIQQHHGRPNTPRAIVSLRVQIKALSAGHRFLCCVDSNGGLWVMGWNEVGQLGLTGTDHVRAFQLHEQMSKTAYVTDVACGKRHSAVLSIDGSVYVSGSNKHGQIGITVPAQSNSAQSGTQPNAEGITASGSSSSANDKKNNSNSQNDPGFPVARRFYKVPLREKCIAIACGPNATMFAMENSFRVFVCGNNEFGQLGIDACLSVNPGQVPVCVATRGLFGVSEVAEFVKFTDPAFVCSGQGFAFNPDDPASLGSSMINVGPDGSVRRRRNNRGTEGGGGGGCCGGGDDDLEDGSGKKEEGVFCSCVIQ